MEDERFETRVIDLDLDHILDEYGNVELLDWDGAVKADIFVDVGKRRVVYSWVVEKDE